MRASVGLPPALLRTLAQSSGEVHGSSTTTIARRIESGLLGERACFVSMEPGLSRSGRTSSVIASSFDAYRWFGIRHRLHGEDHRGLLQ
jgi:hypothetical protein